MPRVAFTTALQRHVDCPTSDVEGTTVREVLERALADNAAALGYILDEHGALRTHMTIFVDGEVVRDRTTLTDRVGPDSEVYVMQALSGG